MRKKLTFCFITLLLTLFVEHTIREIVHADDSYKAGGELMGRVAMAPNDARVNDPSIGFKLGDKVFIGTRNEDGTDLGWQLLFYEENYNKYELSGNSSAYSFPVSNAISSWVAATNQPLGDKTPMFKSASAFQGSYIWGGGTYKLADYTNTTYSLMYPRMKKLNEDITQLNQTSTLIAPRNLTHVAAYMGGSTVAYESIKYHFTKILDAGEYGKQAFSMHIAEIFETGSGKVASSFMPIQRKNLTFSNNYWMNTPTQGLDTATNGNPYVRADGYYAYYVNSVTESNYVRPFINLDLTSVVFGVSKGTGSGVGNVNTLDLDSSYTSLYNETKANAEMKLRILSTNHTATLHDIESSNGKSTMKGAGSVYLNASANEGTDGNAKNTVSALVFDTSGKFLYYRPLETAQDSKSKYKFDLSGIPAGNYLIGIVNEAYDETSTKPADCSKISQLKELEVVETLTEVLWKENLNGTTDFFESGRNVAANSKMGTLSVVGGTTPITYEIIAPASGEDGSSKFKLNMDQENHLIYNSDDSLNVLASEALTPGLYKFRIKAQDANGFPDTGLISEDIELVVYPGSANIKYTEMKLDGGYFDGDYLVEHPESVIAQLSLDPAFVLSGVDITYSIKDIKVNGILADDIEISSANAVLGNITVKGTPISGKHTFTAVVNFKRDGKTYSIEKPNQELMISPSLHFIESFGSSTIIKTLSKTYTDITANQSFNVYTDGGSSVQYRIKEANKDDYVLSLINPTSGIFKIEKAGTTYIEAYIVQDGVEIAEAQLKITIDKASQTLEFLPDSASIKIPLKTANAFTELTIPIVDNKDDVNEQDPLTIYDGGKGNGSITLTSLDTSIADIIDGKLCVKRYGTFNLTAQKIEDAASNYESSLSITKSIQVYEGVYGEYEALKHDIKQGGSDVSIDTIIGHIINQSGTPNTVGKPYTYAIKTNVMDAQGNPNFKIDEDGNLSIINSALKYGNHEIIITITDANSSFDIPLTIAVGLEEQGNFYITKNGEKVTSAISVKMDDPSFVLGTAGGKGTPVKFRLDDSSDSGIIAVSTGGNVSIIAPNGSGKHAYVIAEIDENKTLGYAKQTTKKVEIIVKEAAINELSFTKDGSPIANGKITETYEKDATFQLGIDGAPEDSTITYKLKNEQTGDGKDLSDVIHVSSDGLVHVKNASYTYQMNKVIVEATIKKTGYKDATADVIINIEKANQTTFNFPTSNYEEIVEAGDGSFKINFQKGESSGDIKILCDDGRITAAGTTITYTGLEDEHIIIKAYQKGDRNYEDSVELQMTLTALKKGETKFSVDINPTKLIYGSTAQFIPDVEPGVTYKYEADPSTMDIAVIDPNQSDTILTKKTGNAKFIVTRYVDGVENGKANKTIKVWPKPISVKVKDYEKKVGEALPVFELEPIEGLVGNDDFGTAIFTCDASAISPAKDSYVITAKFSDSEILKNYEFASGGIKPGKLLVTQDEGKKAWYEIIGTKGDNDWYTSDVKLQMKTGFDYDTFSQDQSSWNNEINLTSENVHHLEIWFKNSVSNALSTSLKDTIQIDKTAPIVTSIKAVNSNSSMENILNNISFGTFFKPGTKINIYTSDHSNLDVEVSGTKEVSYKIYPLDKEGKEGTPNIGVAQSINEKASVTMNEVGNYKVCALPKDNGGNTQKQEQCAKVSIKDPEKDYDPNDLGCPSINLTLNTNKAILNIDRDGDGIPDMNVDTNGDGKADINIDNDSDGKPDTNLVILKKWDPTICSSTQQSYGYMPNIKPQINIALDEDYKNPTLNIDLNGDMKADINIDTNDDKKADLNITTVDAWKPEKDVIYEEFQYDTMTDLKRKVNIDSDGDGLPDVNIDYDGDGLPDLNIDIDGNEIPDINIDTNGDGEPDINIDYENDGTIDKNPGTITEWKPDLNTGEKDGFQYDTMGDIKIDNPIHELEHDPSGTIIETVDKNSSFNKKQTIIVANITNEMKLSGMPEVEKFIKGTQEIKNVLNVQMFEDNVQIQPSGKVKVKLPLNEEWKQMKNRKVLIEQKDGTYKEVSIIEENGYLVFETDYLGKISIIGDKQTNAVPDGNQSKPSTTDEVKSVKGVSTIKGMGGAMTGDTTNVILYVLGMIIAVVLMILMHKRKKTES